MAAKHDTWVWLMIGAKHNYAKQGPARPPFANRLDRNDMPKPEGISMISLKPGAAFW
jgi:hypothetical protein